MVDTPYSHCLREHTEHLMQEQTNNGVGIKFKVKRDLRNLIIVKKRFLLNC